MLSWAGRAPIRGLLWLILAFLLICLLSGCGEDKQQTIKTPDSDAPLGSVDKIRYLNSPIALKYTVKNPLEVIHEEMEVTSENRQEPEGEETEGYKETFRYAIVQIDGLKDQEIQTKINESLLVAYEEMRAPSLPPYRGIKTKISPEAKLVQEYIYMDAVGNFNNILSVTLTKDSNYAIPDVKGEIKENPYGYYDNTEYVSEITCLNFDLNTGEAIGLKEVFTDDVDYMSEINDYMNSFLSSNYSTEEGYFMIDGNALKLVESFKGLKAEPKFSLQPHGMVLYFDHETPEFNTGFYAVPITIFYENFQGKIAVGQRFFQEDKNIFQSNATKIKILLIKQQKEPVGGADYFKEGRINVHISWRYSAQYPKELQNFIIAQAKPDEGIIQRLNEEVKDLSQEELEKLGEPFYEISVFADSAGDYINVGANEYYSVKNRYDQRRRYYCFEKESLKKLELAEIFKRGFNYNKVVIGAFKEDLKDSVDYFGVPLEFSAEGIAADIMDNIEGFTLAPDSVNIPITYTDSKGIEYSWLISVDYEEFGCDNMMIFR